MGRALEGGYRTVGNVTVRVSKDKVAAAQRQEQGLTSTLPKHRPGHLQTGDTQQGWYKSLQAL